MNIDFKIPYSTRPHMIKNLGPVFNNKPDPTYLIEKLSELNRFDADLYGSTDKKLEILLIKEACAHLKIPSADTIVDFALNFEEDVAILHKGLLQSICFCFPSSWVPSSRIGMSLEQIHQPVADNQYLLAASNRISSIISSISLSNCVSGAVSDDSTDSSSLNCKILELLSGVSNIWVYLGASWSDKNELRTFFIWSRLS